MFDILQTIPIHHETINVASTVMYAAEPTNSRESSSMLKSRNIITMP
jgi:hypothetical protein